MVYDTERERVRLQNILLDAPISQKSIPSVVRRVNADFCRTVDLNQNAGDTHSIIASQMVQPSATDARDSNKRKPPAINNARHYCRNYNVINAMADTKLISDKLRQNLQRKK